MLVTRPTMPGTALGCLPRGIEPTAVPPAPQLSELRQRRLGNALDEPVVQSEAQGDAAHEGHGNVVPGQFDPLEAVVLFEIAQAVLLLSSVREVRVPEIGDRSLGARSDGLGDQRIRRRLVPVLDHRLDLHEACLPAPLVADQLREADQGLAEKRADEDAPIDERHVFTPHGVEVLAVVPEGLALSDRRLVVDGGDATNEAVIEGDLSHHDAFLLGAPLDSLGMNVKTSMPTPERPRASSVASGSSRKS